MANARILVVDDEPSVRELLEIALRQDGHDVTLADGGEAAIDAVDAAVFDLVVTDLRMRGVDGLGVLRAVKQRAPWTAVVMITAFASTDTAIEAMKLGAYDYVTKPFKLDELRLTIAGALERQRLSAENRALRRQLDRGRDLANFVGRSRRMLDVFETIRKIAGTPSNVMITGETGTGKELVAQAVHHESQRRDRPFVSVNCGAIPGALMESELFGHVRGSFTGAVSHAQGLFVAADGGTLFLDEITEVAESIQVKLLRATQERTIRRVGDTRDVPVDVRLIAASNRDLPRAVAQGVLREDLFYRLNVIPIHLPPLRDRREDIPPLVAHFIDKHARGTGKDVRGISPEALAALERYHWPGNVRELENAVERAVVLGTGSTLGVDALPAELLRPAEAAPGPSLDLPPEGLDLDATLERIERQLMRAALDRSAGVQTRAAELLKMSFRQFRYKLQKAARSRGSR